MKTTSLGVWDRHGTCPDHANRKTSTWAGTVFRAAKKTLALGLILTAAVTAAQGQAPATTPCYQQSNQGVIFYVSTSGDDSLDGLSPEKESAKTGPFATLARARRAVRELRSRRYAQAITVLIRGGTYLLSEPFVFTPNDSGTETGPVTYAAYPGETPVISGASRVSWGSGNGEAVTTLDPGVLPFRQLFVNGTRRYRPRFPADGFYRIAAVPGLNATTPLGTPTNQFNFFPGDLSPAWKNLDDVQVVVHYFWMQATMNVDSIDEQEHLAVFKQSTLFRLSDGNYFPPNGPRYYVDNVYEAMAPGNWYFDKPTNRLTYTRKPGEDELVAYVPQLPVLVRFKGIGRVFVEYITLRGLTFSHTEFPIPGWAGAGESFTGAQYVPGAVALTGSRNITVECNTFAHLGTYGLELGHHTQNILVRLNQFSDLGAGGIKIYDDNPDGTWSLLGSSFGNTLRDNRVVDGGRVFHEAAGILVGNTGPNTITHNEVAGFYNAGILLRGEINDVYSRTKGSVLTYNHVHDIGAPGWLSDMGALYIGGASQGTQVSNNLIHDVEAGRYGAYGIYADVLASGITFEQNIVYRTQSAGFAQHTGRDNIVRNNVFYDSRESQLARSNWEDNTFTFTQNIVLYKTGRLHNGFWHGSTAPVDRNIYFRIDGTPLFGEYQIPFGDWQATGKDTNSFVLDPEFTDPDRGDFTMPEYIRSLIDFRQIHFELVGPSSPASPSPPRPDFLTPSSGSGTSQTFTFKYTDTNGFADIIVAQAIINSAVTYQSGCVAYYHRPTGDLYLHQDTGPAWFGPIAIGTAGTLENSQCSINVGSSSASGATNTLTVNLAITFKAGFTGSKAVWGLVQDNSALSSGWQILGTWTVP